ncbi:MAG: response regulator [Rickettsiales bacterium]|nr:MAG: response regulator [Rickettsiales bacterium]
MNESLNGKYQILMIDDEEINLMCAYMCFDQTYYNLIKANSGETGINYLLNNKVDLIILDLMMPGIGGLEVLEFIRSNNKYRDVPVILQTASQDIEEINKAITIGAMYLPKPYDGRILLEMVKDAMADIHEKSKSKKI